MIFASIFPRKSVMGNDYNFDEEMRTRFAELVDGVLARTPVRQQEVVDDEKIEKVRGKALAKFEEIASMSNPHFSTKRGERRVKRSDIAWSIEREMYRHACEGGAFSLDLYKKKFVMIVPNLKRNDELRDALMTGDISSKTLMRLTSKDMRTKEQRKRQGELEEESWKNAKVAEVPMAVSDQFKCGKCKKRKCVYFEKQVRRADEGSTAYIKCVACGNQWRQNM